MQTSTNIANKTCALLQTTGGKDEPNIIVMPEFWHCHLRMSVVLAWNCLQMKLISFSDFNRTGKSNMEICERNKRELEDMFACWHSFNFSGTKSSQFGCCLVYLFSLNVTKASKVSSLKIPKRLSKAVNWRTDNTTAKRKKTNNGQQNTT